MERWLERGNRKGNKLPDEGYWKYCHSSKQVESFFGGFLSQIVKTIRAHTKGIYSIFWTLKLYSSGDTLALNVALKQKNTKIGFGTHCLIIVLYIRVFL
jgi:hypothetical protein